MVLRNGQDHPLLVFLPVMRTLPQFLYLTITHQFHDYSSSGSLFNRISALSHTIVLLAEFFLPPSIVLYQIVMPITMIDRHYCSERLSLFV